jgi:tetratricopeptide (TPR) repeat protein
VFSNKATALRKQSDARVEKYDKIRADKEKQLDQLQTMNAGDLAQQKRELEEAQRMLKEAQENQKTLINRLDSELFGLQAQYVKAATALEFSIKTSEDITKAIAANVNNLTGKETEALQGVLDAKEKLAEAMKTLSTLSEHKGGVGEQKVKEGQSWGEVLRGLKEAPKVLAAQQAVIDATTKWRRLYALNQTQNRVVKFS